MHLTTHHLQAILTRRSDILQVVDGYALSQFVAGARYPLEYNAAGCWGEGVVVPTKDGARIVEALVNKGLPIADAMLSLFGFFSHHEILVDFEKTDLLGVRTLIGSELRSGVIRLPQRHGRALHDRFNQLFPEGYIRALSPDKVHELLEPLPQGVYQVGKFISGPLGFLISDERRNLPPKGIEHPLLCVGKAGAIHGYHVQFDRPESTAVIRGYDAISQEAKALFGAPHPWERALDTLPLVRHGGAFGDLALALSECTHGEERTELLAMALRSSNGDRIRQAVGSPPRKKSTMEGEASVVASRLAPEEQLQALLVLSDATLVELLDSCCQNGVIRCGLVEVRRPRANYIFDSRDKGVSEISSLGVRWAAGLPSKRFNALIRTAYQDTGQIDDLAWHLRVPSDESIGRALDDLISRIRPPEVVRQLVLPNRRVCEIILRTLGIPSVGEGAPAGEALLRGILWKCGFTVPRYTTTLEDLRERLSEFELCVGQSPDEMTERDRANLRRAGVNLFVSIEEFLESVICLAVWLLASDHYRETKFVFRSGHALRRVPKVLADVEFAIGKWDDGGKNTLGVLLAYLTEASRWVSGLDQSVKHNIRRPDEDCPAPDKWSGQPFAYMHTQFWADCSSKGLLSYAKLFRDVDHLVQQSGVAGVRNALDHKRQSGEFPNRDLLFTFVSRMKQAVDRADAARLFPKEYWISSSTSDCFGYKSVLLLDYRNHQAEIRITGPVPKAKPLILLPEGLVDSSNVQPWIQVGENTPHSAYWEEFPRVRVVNIPDSPLPVSPKEHRSDRAK
jgi:hypothetical protein